MMKLLIVMLLFVNICYSEPAKPTPIVLWHGMGDTCCFPYSLGHLTEYLKMKIPGVYVNSLKIGESTMEEMENSFFMSPNKQIEYACDVISNDPRLKDGFNAIGFSQGSQFLRALIQRCGHKIGAVKNLISMGGQHQGVYGLPHCGALQRESCDYARKLLNYAAYYSWVQKALVQATYWHDPLNEELYKVHSEFLSDVNNEVSINKTYIDNLSNLEHFVMVKFENDTMVQPKETEWFSFYEPGQAKKIITLQESDIYLQDRLGLKKMDEAGKLVFLSQPGDHLRFTEKWFFEKIMKPYLL
ncbi:palmitoyl-protein thioesterase 1 [Leptidea sinapis]|uniref:Palmitoyl-protein thioesterase 1 n=1 Tax=Leptidea sinapis TaxID=189913 RepID=A0A5E4QYY5_9NEOP|nr:palmitoyl-protein thioesterase 1 [Leptidea sinapis]VVD03240.1 unnamed protein product [Leptidea sinapis]